MRTESSKQVREAAAVSGCAKSLCVREIGDLQHIRNILDLKIPIHS